MAESIEVMNKKKEICDYHKDRSKCILERGNNGMNCSCLGFVEEFLYKAEKIIMNWEKPVDWDKVKVDTPILVRTDTNSQWINRHFAKYENGRVYAWNYGHTSWTIESSTPFIFAKLAERE